MQTLMYEIVSVTLCMCAVLTENGTNRLSEQVDVLETFFFTMSQVTKKNPRLLLARGVDAAAIFQYGKKESKQLIVIHIRMSCNRAIWYFTATVCLTMPELQVLKACASFLTNFISQSREISVMNIVQNYGEPLVVRILLNLGKWTVKPAKTCFYNSTYTLHSSILYTYACIQRFAQLNVQ